MDEEEINLLDYWRVIWKRRWLISGLCTISVITVMVISLMSPKIYESTVSIFPPLGDGGVDLSGFLAQAPSAMGALLPWKANLNVQLFVELLQSHTMRDDVVSAFDLVTAYHTETLEQAGRVLAGATKVSTNRGGVIQITVQDRDPQRAAELANFYATNLDRLNQTMNTSRAKQARIFIERRLEEAKHELAKAEQAVEAFQTQYMTVSPGEQASAALSAAAGLQNQISTQEVKLEVMESYLAQTNPDVIRARRELEQLRKQLQWLESGKTGKGQFPGDRFHPAVKTIPQLTFDLGQLQRKLELQHQLFTTLVAQYEQAKIEEIKDMSTVQVLDSAVPSKHKVKPKVRLNMMIAGVLSLFLSLFLAFFLEYLERMRAGKEVVTSQ